MAVWDARNIQVVLFPTKNEAAKSSDLFKSITGTDPDSYQENRIPNIRSPFFNVASGAVEELNYNIQVGVNRVDLTITPLDPEEPDHASVKKIKVPYVLGNLVDKFSSLKSSILGDLTRLSVVTHLLNPADDYNSAASHIFKILETKPLAEGYSDIQLQINRRKDLGDGCVVNRVLRLAVEIQKIYAIEVDSNTGAQTAMHQLEGEMTFSALVIDINTVPEGGVIKFEDQHKFLGKIVKETLEIADRQNFED